MQKVRRIIFTGILLIACCATFFPGCAGIRNKTDKGLYGAGLKVVVDPYYGVDWKNFEQHKANFHAHTTESDGSLSPAEVMDKYRSHGYTILAITDHNVCTYPWENFGRSPGKIGMLAIPGNEHSCLYHMVGLFCEYEPGQYRDLDTVLSAVNRHNGLAILAHPGEYWTFDLLHHTVPHEVVERYKRIFAGHTPYLLGMEVINAGNRWPFDRMLWDAVLTEMMPERPVWGFAAEDSHFAGQIGRDWNVFPLTVLNEQNLRSAMEKGSFYFSTIGTHTKDTSGVDGTPKIISISHNPENGTIAIFALDRKEPLREENYVWISRGRVVYKGAVLHYRQVSGIKGYVRAELLGSGGTTFTNPFGFTISQ